jgi:hypothetical protein
MEIYESEILINTKHVVSGGGDDGCGIPTLNVIYSSIVNTCKLIDNLHFIKYKEQDLYKFK